jgi:hypothetical protein
MNFVGQGDQLQQWRLRIHYISRLRAILYSFAVASHNVRVGTIDDEGGWSIGTNRRKQLGSGLDFPSPQPY